MCQCLLAIGLMISFVYAVVGITLLPPSRPSFTLHSVAPFNATATGNNNATVTTLTPQYWQVSFHLRNPNVRSYRSPAKRGAISYDRVNAFLLLQGRRDDDDGGVSVFHASPAPFEQRAGERTALEMNFSAGAVGVIKDDAVKLSLRWGAEARFHGKTDQSMRVGLVEAVCEDVNVLFSPRTAVIEGGDVECLVGGTWLSYDVLANVTWLYISYCSLCFLYVITIVETYLPP